jgi:opacity protein-like surface antigen
MNKKTLILIHILSMISLNMASQDSKQSIALSIGAALPKGDLALTDVDNVKAGFANTGLSINLNYTYQVHRYIGVSAQLGFMENPIDANAIQNDLNNKFMKMNVVLGMQNLTINPMAKFSLLIGPQGFIPITNKLAITPYVLAGISNIYKSEINYKLPTTAWVKFEGKTGQCFSYLFGLGVQYKIKNKLFLTAKVDYNYSNVDIKDVLLTDATGLKQIQTVNIVVISINPTLGLGYKF